MAETSGRLWRAAVAVLFLTAVIALAAFVHQPSSSSPADQEPNTQASRLLLMGRSLRTNPRKSRGKVNRGDSCNPVTNNICPGISAQNGTQLLYCCKTHCRNVLGDRNNCGLCGNRCGFGNLCCKGACTAVAYDVNNCGKCGKKCKAGQRCAYGMCGYA